MKCPECGNDIKGKFGYCRVCKKRTVNKAIGEPQIIDSDISSSQGEEIDESKVPFFLQMWFIVLVFVFTTQILCVPAIILFIIRIKKYPLKNKKLWIRIGGGIIALFVFTTVVTEIHNFAVSWNENTLNRYIDKGKYDKAFSYVEENYNHDEYEYYSKLASIYEKQGDMDSAAETILKYVKTVDNLEYVHYEAVTNMKNYQGKVSAETEKELDTILETIEVAKEKAEKARIEEAAAAKKAAEKAAAEKKAAEEAAAAKKAAEEKAAKMLDGKAIRKNISAYTYKTDDSKKDIVTE